MVEDNYNSTDIDDTSNNFPSADKKTFALTVGGIYIFMGILQAIASTGVVDIFLVPGNVIGVMVLFVIGGIFLSGYKELDEGIAEGISFIYVGILISILFGIIYLLVMGADALEAYLIRSEDFEGWTPLDDMRPELYLAVLSLFGLFRWKDEFSLKDIFESRHGK